MFYKIINFFLNIIGLEYSINESLEWDNYYKCYRPTYRYKIRRK